MSVGDHPAIVRAERDGLAGLPDDLDVVILSDGTHVARIDDPRFAIEISRGSACVAVEHSAVPELAELLDRWGLA